MSSRSIPYRPLNGKLGIVTGASRGIGTAIAHNLASKGCSLLLGYATSDERAISLATDLERLYGISVVPAGGDLSTAAGCANVVTIAKEHFANRDTGHLQIDILINNAGIAGLKPLGSITTQDFNDIYTTNVLGPLLLTQSCLPYLPNDRSGRIVNVSSVGCGLGLPEQTVYAGSKGALEAMTRVWARELAERATVNSINPGPVVSDMLQQTPADIKAILGHWNTVTPLAALRPEDDNVMQDCAAQYSGRPAYGSEVAGVVAMLCSADAAWTTGSVVSANGGMRFSY